VVGDYADHRETHPGAASANLNTDDPAISVDLRHELRRARLAEPERCAARGNALEMAFC
jgi:hypothetical protein